MTYYELLDSEHSGDIIKVSDSHDEWKYDKNVKEWIPGSYMMDYFLSFFDESPYSEDSYREISEAEALSLIGEALNII